VPVAVKTPPLPTQLACLSPSRRFRDPKVQHFTDFMIKECREALTRLHDTLEAHQREAEA